MIGIPFKVLEGFRSLENWLHRLDRELSQDASFASRAVELSIRHEDEYRSNFVREHEAQKYASDPCVPTGETHYIIAYNFCRSSQCFKTTRMLARHFDYSHELYFDYYGPEEDGRGLIIGLDY